MKLRYQLRGIGIGLLVTAFVLILMQPVYNTKPNESDSPKETSSTGSILAFDKDATKIAEDTETPADSETKTEAIKTETVKADETVKDETKNSTLVTVHLADIVNAKKASDILFNAGIISDKDGFTKYLVDNGYSQTITDGYYEFEVGESFESIAKKIINK